MSDFRKGISPARLINLRTKNCQYQQTRPYGVLGLGISVMYTLWDRMSVAGNMWDWGG